MNVKHQMVIQQAALTTEEHAQFHQPPAFRYPLFTQREKALERLFVRHRFVRYCSHGSQRTVRRTF